MTAPVAKILALRAQGKGYTETARILGLPAANVEYQYRCAGQREYDERFMPKANRKRRACMTCGSQFTSEGAHNRVCDGCKLTGAWRDGNDDTYPVAARR